MIQKFEILTRKHRYTYKHTHVHSGILLSKVYLAFGVATFPGYIIESRLKVTLRDSEQFSETQRDSERDSEHPQTLKESPASFYKVSETLEFKRASRSLLRQVLGANVIAFQRGLHELRIFFLKN